MSATASAPAPQYVLTVDDYRLADMLVAVADRRSGRRHGDTLDLAALRALVRASRKFDPSRGVAFGAFARRAIRMELASTLRRLAYVGGDPSRPRPQVRGFGEGAEARVPAKPAEVDAIEAPGPALDADLLSCLTPAERDVLRLRVGGLDFCQVARARGTSKQHAHAAYGKAVRKLHAAAAARRAGSN